MKAKLMLMLATLILLMAGCEEGRTINGKYVPCIGVSRDDENPNYTYQVSTQNAVLGVVFFEMLFPPIIVLVAETYCPVTQKEY